MSSDPEIEVFDPALALSAFEREFRKRAAEGRCPNCGAQPGEGHAVDGAFCTITKTPITTEDRQAREQGVQAEVLAVNGEHLGLILSLANDIREGDLVEVRVVRRMASVKG